MMVGMRLVFHSDDTGAGDIQLRRHIVMLIIVMAPMFSGLPLLMMSAIRAGQRPS